MFSKLIRSEQFWLAVVDLVQIVLLSYLGVPAEMWGAINGILLVIIGALTVDDVVEKASLMLKDTLLEMRKLDKK